MLDLTQIRIVDVTLRDGGYRNNFDFGMDYVVSHVRSMQRAGIDFIEIGYRNGSLNKIDRIGRTGLSENAYIDELRAACPAANLGVIVHAHNIGEQDIRDLAERGVRLIRFCAKADTMKQTIEQAGLAKQLGLTTTINVVRISSYSLGELGQIFGRIAASADVFDVVYTADSNGHLSPDQVDAVYGMLRTLVPKSALGFHAHDNIGQAMANTLRALEMHDVTYVDASLLGMGKGIGNLRLEQLIAYLNRKGAMRYDPIQVLCATERLRNNACYVENDEYGVDVISGFHNLSIVERQRASDIWRDAQLRAAP